MVVFSCLYLVGAGLLNCLDLVYSVRVLVSSCNIMLLAGCDPNQDLVLLVVVGFERFVVVAWTALGCGMRWCGKRGWVVADCL